MRRCKGLMNRLVMAALVSALAALLMVAVGPGFAENDTAPNGNATGQENAAENEAGGNGAVASSDRESEVENPDKDASDIPGNAPDTAAATSEEASTTPDDHGHIGAGTGIDEGSQADPGHHDDKDLNNDGVDDQHDGTDGKTNGPGTGDENGTEEDCGTNLEGSNADFSGSGANRHGPYDSTCDGDHSENGQGHDAPGAGTPCAGCSGSADNKQPPGQVREFYGEKSNDMGYECDGNQGVGAHYGRGNPAHTGDCQTNEEVCVDNPDTQMDECNPETELVCRMDVNGNWNIEEIIKGTRLSTDKDADAEECDDTVPPQDSLSISVTCTSVTAVSTKNISSVKVVYLNGDSDTFHPNDKTFTHTSTSPIASATAKASDMEESDSTAGENCGTTPPVDSLTISVTCTMVTAGSTKNISSVKVVFKDGSSLTFHPAGDSFTQTFTTPVDSATAKSAGMEESDSTAGENCGVTPATINVCRKIQGEWDIVPINPLDRENSDKDAPSSMNPEDCAKVTICHATGSMTNPYVEITVSENALKRGHDATHGDLHPVDEALCVVVEAETEEVCRFNTTTNQFEVVPIPKGTRQSGDMDVPANKKCAQPETEDVCRMNTTTNQFEVVTIPKGTRQSGDMDVPANKQCVQPSVISICYQDSAGNWAVVEDINPSTIGNYSNAKVVAKGTPASSCEEDDIVRRSSHVYVCHVTGSTPAWEVIRISVSALATHLGHGDKVVVAGTDASECEDAPETEVCPEGTDMAGLPFPADLNCNLGPNEELPNRLCPVDSDRPMRVIPQGQDETWCDDDVEGELIQRPATPKNPEPGNPGDNVAPNRLQNRPETAPSRQPRGGILPFTGASVLAFLVLALQLIAAGTLILRGKRA